MCCTVDVTDGWWVGGCVALLCAGVVHQSIDRDTLWKRVGGWEGGVKRRVSLGTIHRQSSPVIRSSRIALAPTYRNTWSSSSYRHTHARIQRPSVGGGKADRMVTWFFFINHQVHKQFGREWTTNSVHFLLVFIAVPFVIIQNFRKEFIRHAVNAKSATWQSSTSSSSYISLLLLLFTAVSLSAVKYKSDQIQFYSYFISFWKFIFFFNLEIWQRLN